MKFSEYKYERPSFDDINKKIVSLIDEMKKSNDFEEFDKNIVEINKIRNHVESMKTLASLKYSINTRDESIALENKYWDEHGPEYKKIDKLFYETIVNSSFEKEIEQKYGKHFYKLVEFSLKEFSEDIVEELKIENKLCSEYTKLLASAKILYDGKYNNLSQMNKYMLSDNREERRKSSEQFYNYFESIEDKFDSVFDELVKVRDRIAKKLGYDNFVELGYIRMKRTEYNESDVVKFRDEVRKKWIPLVYEFNNQKKKRLGIDELKYYDDDVEYPGWNMEPETDYDETIEAASKMYHELSKETGEFFDFMVENGFMDLETKESKGFGGYCTYIPEIKAPFIFSNFNKTFDDVDTLTHEAGHAFQLYMSRDIDMPEINFPTLDCCEIHSMSMELLTWPWMKLFFKDNDEKFKRTHMATIVRLIPYCMIVDEFQHIIYKNPELTPLERKSEWRRLEKVYTPWKNYDGNDFLEKGCWWFKQGHIFKNPFYYIDYALAEVCALQIWTNMQNDYEVTLDSYMEICKDAGKRSFIETVEKGNLKSPFEKGCLDNIIEKIYTWSIGKVYIK
ncbi:M3 family oligoendopeptidase [Peptacetobacter hiranonis]|uniref:M3 family oligoendopeptidase n=1 Tax=Peptacetobacter hiranonis TaxID=89152 RepID=UPI0022E4CDF5|nr:M3 family oligoendopeptidase [Peptacetobacter hiranonis]